MDIKPYWHRLIAWVKNAIVDLTKIFIGMFIGIAVAGHWYERHSWYWFVTVFGVYVVYAIVLWLLELAWSRWRTGQKGPV